MRSRRGDIDYALARRSTILDVLAGRVSTTDVCDAHPYLLRAARYHGEPTADTCPLCRREQLCHVTYVYGDELGAYNGRVRATRELALMEPAFSEFTVYVVEVCRGCGWNFRISSFVLGAAAPPQRRPRRTVSK